MLYKTYYKSEIGKLLLVSDGIHLLGLWIENQKYYLYGIEQEIVFKDDLEIFTKTKHWLGSYFSGKNPSRKELNILLNVSPFQKEVLKILCKIPYGQIMTYGEVSKILENKLKRKMSAQAVGGAISHNPISIIIPCHRVIGKGGKLTGYAGGIDKKLELLKLEKIDVKEE